jgi:outer membrane protein W
MAQSSKKRKQNTSFNSRDNQKNKFLEKQWWLGIKAGTNLASADVVKSFSVISPTNYEAAEKEYDGLKNPGLFIALEASFTFRQFSLSVQPAYRNSVISYTNNYEWNDVEVPQNSLTLTYDQTQRIEHIEFPLLLRYEITQSRLRPYVQAGAFYAIRVNATKSVSISGVDYATGGTDNFKKDPFTVGANDLFAKYHWGLMGGAGVYYHLGNVRLNLEVSYRKGMSLANDPDNRYANTQLSGVGDAGDDFKLNSLSISAGCLFPLRFLASGFKSVEN